MRSRAKRYSPFNSKKKSTFSRGKSGNFLYVFLAPIFLATFLALLAQDISGFIKNIISFGLFLITAKLNSIALEKEYDYHSKVLTKAPKVPLKGISALLLGISTLYTSWIAGGDSMVMGIFLGIIATIGYFLYYGFDPRDDKLENIGDISAEFVLRTLAEARAKLSSIETDISMIKDKNLNTKLHVALQKAYEVLSTIEKDPKDLRVARKFIIVYIDGIKKVTKSYTDMVEEEITVETKLKLSNLLTDVEDRFEKEIIRLKKNNQFDLDVHIDVLQEQIKR
jgi:5-bromo-4-chloroindolyl phosphate hydrolysis protein